jgi:hypothetical protein
VDDRRSITYLHYRWRWWRRRRRRRRRGTTVVLVISHFTVKLRFSFRFMHLGRKWSTLIVLLISRKARLTGRGTCGLAPVIGAFVGFPKFLAGVVETVARPKAGAEEVNAARTGATVGGLKVAARLRSSSSPACLLASACLSLQVSFLAPPAVD